jgi:ketosteroid isomerase-like protein
MSNVDNKAVLKRAIEKWNAGDLDAYLGLYSPNAIVHLVPPGFPSGIKGIRKFYEGIWADFSKCQIVIHDLFGEGEKVACRYTVHATLQDTDEDITAPGITMLRFSSGKCVERWDSDDN